jgi:hypothetical protein
MAVGIAVNDAVGNPFESSSAVSSQRVVYAHGSGTVFQTDIYETFKAGSSSVAPGYAAGDLLYASRNGLLTNAAGLVNSPVVNAAQVALSTVVGILLKVPTSTDPFMTVQMKI